MLAISSVGSLRLDWPVGTFVVVDDFYAPHETTAFHDDPQSHVVPGFDPAWSERVRDAWHDTTDTRLVDGGIYAQTRGPRFETPAEVRALTHVADLVGMTVAAECIVATEVKLAYAAICVVDNLANGLGTAPLTIDEFNAGVASQPGPPDRGPRRGAPGARGGAVSLCVTDVRLDGGAVAIRAVDGQIAALGPDVVPDPTDQVVAGRGPPSSPGWSTATATPR